VHNKFDIYVFIFSIHHLTCYKLPLEQSDLNVIMLSIFNYLTLCLRWEILLDSMLTKSIFLYCGYLYIFCLNHIHVFLVWFRSFN